MRFLIVAPHPDDDIVGCGATLAAAFAAGHAVRIAYVTDGSASHPGSKAWDARRIAALREREAAEAVARLGGSAATLTFLRVADGAVAALSAERREHVANELRTIFAQWQPTVVFSPWRRDPHPDHVAVSALVRLAAGDSRVRPRLLEYGVWLGVRGAPGDGPPGEMPRVTFDCEPAARERKRHALLAHRSQTTRLIDDDPDGFLMTPDLIERFCSTPEVFYEDIA